MKVDIITIFPEQLRDYIEHGIFRIAVSTNKVEVNIHDLRDWTTDKHRTVDNRPYGGGAGMVMKIEPVFKAIREIKQEEGIVIIPTPRGKKMDQELIKDLYASTQTNVSQIILLCGHYEGFDERVHEYLADIEISIGDYILSGGELPALVLLDAFLRYIPGVLGNESSVADESFENDRLEYPQYTRPENFNGWKVPEILLSGDHQKIDQWRKARSLEETLHKRHY